MHLFFYRRTDWETWGLGRRPLIPEGMALLVDEDLIFEEHGNLRPAAVVNRWLQELPISGAPSPHTRKSYAQALPSWLEYLATLQVSPFGEQAELRQALALYAEYRLGGPLEARWDEGFRARRAEGFPGQGLVPACRPA